MQWYAMLACCYVYEFTVMSIYSHNSPQLLCVVSFIFWTPLSYCLTPPRLAVLALLASCQSTRGRGMWHEDTYLTKLYKTSLVQTVLSLTQPLKNDAWKTIPSYWVSVTFQGRAVKLREGNPKCSRPTITLPPGSGSTKSSCRGVALKTSWRHWATHPQNKHPKKDQLNLYRNYKPCIYTNYMHNILYIVYIYIHIFDIVTLISHIIMCIYILWLTLRSFSLKITGVRSSALEPLPHWQFAPMISSPGRTLWGKPYDTVCMLSSVLLRLARTSQSSQCFVTPLWAQAAMFWFLSEGHGNLWDYRLKLQVARGIKIYHHKISWDMKCRKTTRRLTRSPDSGKSPRQSLKETFTLLARQRLFDALH